MFLSSQGSNIKATVRDGASQVPLLVKRPLAKAGGLGDAGPTHGREDPRRSQWQSTPVLLPGAAEAPGGLQSMGSLKVRHDFATEQQDKGGKISTEKEGWYLSMEGF